VDPVIFGGSADPAAGRIENDEKTTVIKRAHRKLLLIYTLLSLSLWFSRNLV
jgi:hypothetical protein